MREYLLYLVILVLVVAGFRDWFITFGGLIILTAFMDRQDMPRTIAGIPGLNPWNVLLSFTLLHWFLQRSAQRLHWDMPRLPAMLMAGYLAAIVIGYIRAAIDIDDFPRGFSLGAGGGGAGYTVGGLFIDELVNPFRYMIPAILVYDGVRSRTRVKYTLIALILMGVWYAFFVVRCIPIGTLTGELDPLRSRKRLQFEIGLHANDMAFVLVFMFWGIVAAIPAFRGWVAKAAGVGASALVALGVGLCQSRGGFIGFIVVGTALAVVRKPIALLLLPILAVTIPLACPGIVERLSTGFGDESSSQEEDWDQITAGRVTNLWPPALEWIAMSPLIGHGRYAMLRDRELFGRILESEGTVPSHPHNAYLEVLLDYGALALVVILAIFGGICRISLALMRMHTDPLFRAVGAIAFAAAIDNLVVGISSRALLPRPSMMGMWCVFALALRLWVQSAPRPTAVGFRRRVERES